MSEKAKDPEVIAKKIPYKPIDYENLNSLTDDFEKRFSTQQELSAEQAFWFHILNPSIESSYTPPVIVEVPNELPKKRTTPNALEEGEWGFEHTKSVFNNEIIPFLKSLKDIFNVFDKDLLNEITEVQTVFDQMDVALQQSLVDKQCLEIVKKEILLENDRLLQKIMSQDVLLTVINSMSWNNDSMNMEMQTFSMQLKQEVFQNDESCVNHNGVEIQEYFEINDLKARLQDKDTTICKLKDTIKSLKENTKEENVNNDKWEIEPINKELENSVAKLLSENERKEIVENVVHTPSATTIAPGMFKLDLEPLPPRLLHNREVHIDYLRNTQEQANFLWEIVEQAKAKQPLDSELDLAWVKCSTSNCGSKPPGNKRNDRISQTPSRNKNNKVEAQPRKVNKVNRVVKPVCDVVVKHSLSKVNSEILCATCNKSMFDGVHDKCLVDLVQNGNKRTKSAKKHKKQNVWKLTGHVFTEVGFKWKPTSRTFTIVGNSCPLTSFTSTNVVPPKQTTSHSDEIQKPKIKVYCRRPKNVKNIGSSKIAKIVESKNANNSEPNQTWGSNATDIPSSFSLVMTGCPDCTLVSGLRMLETHDRESLSAHELCLVYYVEGLGHNLFSVGQFCDADLEVAFWKNTCFIGNLEGVDLLSGSRDTNLYTISLDDMIISSPIFLLSKASKTKSCLWHRRLSYLNFGTLNKRSSKKKVSVSQPEGLLIRTTSHAVTAHNRTLYGLEKQAPSAWYDMLSSLLISQQFSKGAVDPTLFTRHARNDILLVQIYVDDVIFASTNTAMCNEFANQMTNKFKMSMMGKMSFFLGLHRFLKVPEASL
ncbi:integrase, catalytic region, zinc finger, CCHC-type containing protein [Tanacetum coccineum]